MIQYFVYDLVAYNRELVSEKEKKKIKKKRERGASSCFDLFALRSLFSSLHLH